MKMSAKQLANKRLLSRYDVALKSSEMNIMTVVSLTKKIQETSAWRDATDANGVNYVDWQGFLVDTLSSHKALYALMGPALINLLRENGCTYSEIEDVTGISKSQIGRIVQAGSKKPNRQDNTPAGKASRAGKAVPVALAKYVDVIADQPAAEMQDVYSALVLAVRAVKAQARLNGVVLTEPDTNPLASDKVAA